MEKSTASSIVPVGQNKYSVKSIESDDYQSLASVYQNATRTGNGRGISNFLNKTGVSGRFPKLYNGFLPYEYNSSNGCVTLTEAIELCMKAWANVAIVRNTIEAQVEFSNSPIHVNCKNNVAKKAVQAFLKKINARKFAEKFFRELYRSGNVFIYRVEGKLNDKIKEELNTLYGYGIKDGGIPVKYIILNPVYIAVQGGITSDAVYLKILNSYEAQRLANPTTEFEKQALKSLDQKSFTPLANKNGNTAIKTYEQAIIPLDPEKVRPVFYQKQDYEPLAIPPIWGVLDDIELKLEFKEADKKVARCVDKIILLVTAGADPDKGGVNPEVLDDLTKIFQNQMVQRVLIADYTTKAEFIIPDLKKVLGKEKYEVVNQDIREGLQSIIVGDEKFSNQLTKVKLFLERLREGKNDFLEYLQSEVEFFCKSMGFRHIPTLEMEEINLKDEVQLQRVFTRLYELGLLTPEENIKAIKTGILPDHEESLKNQREFLKLKEERLYEPVNNRRGNAGAGGEGSSSPGRPEGESEEGIPDREQRVVGSSNEVFAAKAIASVMGEVNGLKKYTESKAKKKYKVKSLNEKQEKMVNLLVYTCIAGNEKANWKTAIDKAIAGKEIPENESIMKEVERISRDYSVEYDQASILFHSKEENFKK